MSMAEIVDWVAMNAESALLAAIDRVDRALQSTAALDALLTAVPGLVVAYGAQSTS